MQQRLDGAARRCREAAACAHDAQRRTNATRSGRSEAHRAWTTKTALLFGDWIRSYKQPPDGVWAWLFAVNAHPAGRLATSFGGWFAGYDGRADAYLRTFHVGALGFRALGVTHNREVTTAPPRSPSGLRARPGADLAPARRQLAGRRLGRSAWGDVKVLAEWPATAIRLLRHQP
jgi:hypothetical protein